jgi:putative transcription factor
MVGIMSDCEICGKEMKEEYEIELEGAHLTVCEDCSRGKPAQKRGNVQHVTSYRRDFGDAEQDEVVEGYGAIMRRARESAGMSLKELGEKINEKESILSRIEWEKTTPPDSIARKLEKELGIKIIQKKPAVKRTSATSQAREATLADFIEKKEGK